MSANQSFIKRVYTHYYRHNRNHTMPWRIRHDPYSVFLSEMMLQQTQVSRVIEYFNTFMYVWPSIEQLATASLADVLHHWRGLGYNRRAKYLHDSAKMIVNMYNATIPEDEIELQKLPGIGVYTSAAIRVFAFNKSAIVLETNIRRAIIHWFFKNHTEVEEQSVRDKIGECVALIDEGEMRVWYWALMDYGVFLTKHVVNPNRKSRIYRKQSVFQGSNRQIRGAIVRVLLDSGTLDKETIIQKVHEDLHPREHLEPQLVEQEKMIYRLNHNIHALEKEGLVVCENNQYYLP